MVNVQKNNPKTAVSIDAKRIQAGPLIKDVLEKELIEGTLKTDIQLSMAGEKPDMIKQTLTGQGELLFTDGALSGIDLANMVRIIKSKTGIGEKLTEKPRTDFVELKIPFTVRNGLVNTSRSSLMTPLVRVVVTGNANLVKEVLDLRVEPKNIATLKGPGDTKQRSGLMVPVLITGTFASSKIRPYLKGMIGGDITKSIEGLKEGLIPKEGSKVNTESAKEDVKAQLKGLLPDFIK